MSDQPKQLSERISFRRTPDELSVVITQEVPRLKETLLFVWVIAWLTVGVAYISFWITSASSSSDRMFFAVATAFWAYFFVRSVKVYLWRKVGKETLRLHGEGLWIKNAWGNWGRAREYHTSNIKRFGIIPYDVAKFGQFMERSFWVIGGNTLGFEYHGNKVQFAKQLSDNEARQLARIIEKALREIPARSRRKAD